jgi:hypothetical protein
VRFMFCVWQFCFRRASLSRFIHRFPSNQGQAHCFDFVCQLSPICNSPVDTPMIISSFIFAVNTCYQHDKLFTKRQIQIVLILFQSHCTQIAISCSPPLCFSALSLPFASLSAFTASFFIVHIFHSFFFLVPFA